MNRSAIILAALVFVLTPQAVANRCVNEASFAIEQCACTVYNRLHAEPLGWNPAKVLEAYHASDGHADAAQVATVAAVLAGETACGAEYFLYSREDVRWLGYERYTPVAVVRSGGKEVRIYSRWFQKEQSK